MRDVFVALLAGIFVVGGGLLAGEVIYQISNALLRREWRKQAREEHKARVLREHDLAVMFAQTVSDRPVYIAYEADYTPILVADNPGDALKAIIGKQGAFIIKDGDEKVAQNRTLVQGGGKK